MCHSVVFGKMEVIWRQSIASVCTLAQSSSLVIKHVDNSDKCDSD